MRPENVTEADIAKWEQARQDYIKEENSFIIKEPPPEMWYAGEWLYEQLKALNCTKELRHQICFAAGQRQSYSTDYWQTVVTILENYKEGIWDTPGPELAAKLMRERFGDNPDPYAVLDSLVSDGADPEKLLAMAMQARMETIIQPKKKAE